MNKLLVLFLAVALPQLSLAVPVADRFQVPLNPPTGEGYNITAGWGWLEWEPGPKVYHPGEDWNGNGGSDTDLGDSVRAIASGLVIAAGAYGQGWGNIVVIEHELSTGTVIWSQYAHLESITVSKDEEIVIGDEVGIIGQGHNKEYINAAHLHLEIRKKHLAPNNWPKAKQTILDNYLEPTAFIKANEKPIEECEISSKSANLIHEDNACTERGGKYWWDIEYSTGKGFYTYTTDDAEADSYMKWYLSFENAGLYRFEAYIPSGENWSRKAVYKFWLKEKAEFKTVDQDKYAGKWALIGELYVAEGGDQALRLNDNTGEKYMKGKSPKLAIDGIRITKVKDITSCANPPCEDATIPDENQSNTTTGGGCVQGSVSTSRTGLFLLILFALLVLASARQRREF